MSIEELVEACAFGELEEVRKLVEMEGIDVNGIDEDSYIPIEVAIENNEVEIVQYLLSKGALLDNKTSYYHMVCQSDDGVDMITTLIDANVSWNQERNIVADYAIEQYTQHGDLTLINKMFESRHRFLNKQEWSNGFLFLHTLLEQYSSDNQFIEDRRKKLFAHFIAEGCDINNPLVSKWIYIFEIEEPELISYIDGLKKITVFLNRNGIRGPQVKPYLKNTYINDTCVKAVSEGLCRSIDDLEKLAKELSKKRSTLLI